MSENIYDGLCACHTGPVREFTQVDRTAMTDTTFAQRYREAAAHQARRDGEFVTGHVMSETFCRPGCAIRTPRPSRVRFFSTAAAAEAAGMRPCPRCRPDALELPTAHAAGRSFGARALRLIADGEVDRNGIGGVAQLLHITPRHLLRAVEAVADCGPLDVARSQRAHAARLLLTSSSAPMGIVAAASGFATVRQFNSTVSRFYGMTPSRIRDSGPRERATGTGVTGAETLTGVQGLTTPLVVRCALPALRPYDAAATFRALAIWAVPEVEACGELWYSTTMRLPHDAGHCRIDGDGRGRLFARLTVADPRDFVPLYARARALFDADCDSRVLGETRSLGPELTTDVAAHPEVRLPGSVAIPEAVIRAMIEFGRAPVQARTVLGGLAVALGRATPWGPLFPTAGQVADHGRDVLRGDRREIDGVIRVARLLADGSIVVHAGSSCAALIEQLMAVPGIDAPRATYVAMRVLGEPGWRS